MGNLLSFIGLLALGVPSVLPAQRAPDTSNVQIPDLSGGRDPDVVRNGWKYFYFWKAGVSYQQAYADFEDCYQFLPIAGTDGSLPMFATWDERPPEQEAGPPSQSLGIVGAIMGEMVAGPIIRRAHQSRLRRCMEPRGYQRYPLQERRWEELTDNFSPASIAAQAKAASGPAPDGDPLPVSR